ncbi:conjugal transfer protein TraG [Bradyrhizobium sp. 61]|uniref:conjugal transfer protein TraG n=1 Tax=unclassified Bradyrhizobium TaxID=2631580 RepID=UPI001FFA7F01|nr:MULTISPECIES: conjugal transfer protein TraG [unclassified Bradyrhizobium]MCK1274414.1 conjugal transfer protein TraG [Bradyrhizobium sp. 61]MCK1459809.1 conjugal transfer protein TraG [Bradyrhizobium sp. 2]
MFPAKIYVGQIAVVFGIVVASTWGATQWTAAALGYQQRLGEPWFLIVSYPVYLPWRLFEWWFAYEAYAPEIFEEGGAIAAGGGIAGALFAIVNSVWRARQSQLVTTYGSARWATAKEIKTAGLFASKGVFLGRLENNYLRHDGPEHVMCFAPTRSGKGVGLVLPTLLSWTSSAVVHDIKGENWELTSGWRSTFSHCLLFNPTDSRSARYNPLLEVRKGAAEVRDVQNIADILVDPEGALERRTHWEKTSHSLLVGVILHVLYAEEKKTLTRVTEILADPAQSFEKTLRVMLATNHLGTEAEPKVHPVVAATARELLNKSENERSGVLSTAVSFLGLYRDPVVSRNTEHCDWRIADLVSADKPVTLYLVVPPSDISRTKPLIRLILNQIGRRLTETLNTKAGDRRHRQLLMMLDEFPALGRLDFFESALAFMAGYGIRAYLIAQSLNQIAKAYGENNAILDNCHVRIAFAANDERTAKRISDALGTATELRAQRNYAGHRLAPWLGHVMVSRQETARPLLTPGEVMQLPPDQAIVLVSGLAPVRAIKLRHYEDANFVSRLRKPPSLVGDEYADRPPARLDDWRGELRTTDLRLATLPYRELMQTGGEEGGLKQQLALFDEAVPVTNEVRPIEDRLLDDESDVAADRSQMQQAASASGTVRRAHAVTRDDDDLLPSF